MSQLRRAIAATALAVVVCLAPGTARTEVVKQGVRGPMAAVAEDGTAQGRFRLRLTDRPEEDSEWMRVDAIGLEARRDGEGVLPVYRVVLIEAEGAAEADFGEVFLSARGRAGLGFASRRSAFPEGVASLAEFGGGTIEIRRDGEAVLRGDIPAFIGLGDENPGGAFVRAHDVAELRPPAGADDDDGRGVAEARVRNVPNGTDQQFRLLVADLEPNETHDVVVIGAERAETELGSFRARTRLGVGTLNLDTRDGDRIDVLAFAGLAIEIRDEDGTVVLVGRFPTID